MSPFSYVAHVDSRIRDPGCKVLGEGDSFSQKVIEYIVQTNLAAKYPLLIPERNANTGLIMNNSNGQPILNPIALSDHYVSVWDLFENNDQHQNWGKSAKYNSRYNAVNSHAVDFSAQLTLAASYGLLQVTYVLAIDRGWKGNNPSPCDPVASMDPDNLFDTDCNLTNHSGSLGIGSRYTVHNFITLSGRSPSMASESNFEQLLIPAYQLYNKNFTNKTDALLYGEDVINKSKNHEPNPAGTIFTTGGQQ